MITGDVFGVLPTLEPESFDAILCDPPYLLEFMSRSFDTQHKRHESPRLDQLAALGGKLTDDVRATAWHADWLDLALPLLRPGGRLVAASGSRVYHQLATAAALVGFEVDPLFAWINGQPMAQGLAIDKAIDKAAGAEREVLGASRWDSRKPRGSAGRVTPGLNEESGGGSITAPATPLAALFEGYSTRLKDAVCPWLMAHKPPDGTWAQNAERHGLAGLDVDGGRVPTGGRPAIEKTGQKAPAAAHDTAFSRSLGTTTQGRYPSNLALSPEAAEELGRQSGRLQVQKPRIGGGNVYGSQLREQRPAELFDDDPATGAERFFHSFRYQAKTGPAERLKGCESFFWRVSRDHRLGFERIDIDTWVSMDHLPGCEAKRKRKGGAPSDLDGLALFDILELELRDEPERGCRPGCQHRKRYRGNIHPTLKPIELIKYLAGLVLPPDTGRPRRVLVLFAGTYSEAIGCDLAGWDEVVGIESEPVYVEIGEARRLAWVPETATAEQLQLTGAMR